jgi:hypothetical protein
MRSFWHQSRGFRRAIEKQRDFSSWQTSRRCVMATDFVCLATRNLVRSLGFTIHTFASAEEFLHAPQLNDTACDVPAMAAVGREHGAACLRWRDTSEVLAEVAPE